MFFESSDFVRKFNHSDEMLSFNAYMIMLGREFLACLKQ